MGEVFQLITEYNHIEQNTWSLAVTLDSKYLFFQGKRLWQTILKHSLVLLLKINN